MRNIVHCFRLECYCTIICRKIPGKKVANTPVSGPIRPHGGSARDHAGASVLMLRYHNNAVVFFMVKLLSQWYDKHGRAKRFSEGRKPKQYSEKLFNELCILYLLLDSSNLADAYIVKLLFDASPRTVRRYTAELHASGVTPPISYKRITGAAPAKKRKKKRRTTEVREPKSDQGYAYTCPVWEHGGWDTCDDFQEYSRGNLNGERRRDRLFRCGYMMIRSFGSLRRIDDADPEDYIPGDVVMIDGTEYVFAYFDRCEELYEEMSPRTQQRDMKVVKDVLVKMKRYSD